MKSETLRRYGKRIFIEHYKEYFGEDKLLSSIRYVDLENYRT